MASVDIVSPAKQRKSHRRTTSMTEKDAAVNTTPAAPYTRSRRLTLNGDSSNKPTVSSYSLRRNSKPPLIELPPNEVNRPHSLMLPVQHPTQRAVSPSPSLRRSDGLMNLDQASLGTASLRSRQIRQTSIATPKRVAKQPQLQMLQNKHHEFATPGTPTSKLRKHISVENFMARAHRDSPFGTPAPAPNASIHPHNTSRIGAFSKPHPLSNAATYQESPAPPSPATLFEKAGKYNTPSFKYVKPLQTAFMSTGLISKRNRPATEATEPAKPPPDTPCKRPTMLGTPMPPTPGTPLGPKEFFPELKHPNEENSLEDYMFLENEGDSSFFYTSSSSEFGNCPPTPTRGLFGTGTNTNRKKPLLFSRSPCEDGTYLLDHMESLPLDTSKLLISQTKPTSVLPSHPGSLEQKFQNIEKIGAGEFSEVFLVEERGTGDKYAIKKTKLTFSSSRDRTRRLEEVEILKALGKHEHVIELFDSWEEDKHLLIQLEYCENGSLDVFLHEYGRVSKLDEFRVWKVLTELALGLAYIHEQHFLHLDLKPANIFITFEGVLKIGDFGMSVAWPAPAHTEREGDREYIAPEVLSSGRYDKPVDLFSLGLIILEVAANIVLPDNGLSWQKLRSGDLSDAPKLSSSDPAVMVSQERSANSLIRDIAAPHRYLGQGGLDRAVKWMLSPDPSERPSCADILQIEEVVWVNRVRKAGAIIFEGDRGPEGSEDMYDSMEPMDAIEEEYEWRMEL